MKLLYCNTCRDIVKLYRTTRTCHCGATGGHYREDGLNAIYYGPAIPLGFANSSFRDARDNQPEFGMGTVYNAFVIPKVCPTMELVDSEYYTEVFDIEDDEYSVDIMMARAEDEKKQRKLKNVFKGES
tara:strand:+ start:265 stop:648 length:384 start_codon:yes stop_codon:yes gene_type:complete